MSNRWYADELTQADWTKAGTWDLQVTTGDDLVTVLGDMPLEYFLALPAAQAMPARLRQGLRAKGITAAADNEANGAMIALVPSNADLDRLALLDDIEGAEGRDILHLTLWFLGEGADWSDQQRQEMINFVESRVGDIGTVHGRGFGINFWNPDGDNPSWNLAVGDAEEGESLSNVRDMLSPRRVVSPDENPMPDQHSPWVPHVCLAYSSDPGLAAELVDRVGDITFDRVRVVFAGDQTDIDLKET